MKNILLINLTLKYSSIQSNILFKHYVILFSYNIPEKLLLIVHNIPSRYVYAVRIYIYIGFI